MEVTGVKVSYIVSGEDGLDVIYYRGTPCHGLPHLGWSP